MKKHFNSYRKTLNRLWEAKGDEAQPKNCRVEMWNAMFTIQGPQMPMERVNICVLFM